MPLKDDPDHFVVREGAGRAIRRAIVARTLESGGPHNTLNQYSSPVLLEYQDTFFHNDSAVMMPDAEGEAAGETKREHVMDDQIRQDLERSQPGSYERFATTPYEPPSGDGAPRVSGLGMIAASYKFLKANDGYKLLVAGHSDTTGAVDYNFTLSELRARNVIHLLLGERDEWVGICERKSHVEDRQRILKHVARVFGWPCDPGPIDNEDGPRTRGAVRSFQQQYNHEIDQAIDVDGVVGKQTWGAFFDVYMKELSVVLGTDPSGLPGQRVVRFLDEDNKFIACGEKAPIAAPDKDSYRSAENRRVELLYFKAPMVPDLSCHRGDAPHCMKSCDRGACSVYAPGRFQFVYLDPRLADVPITNKTVDGQYAMRTIDDDLSGVLTEEDRAPLTLSLHGPIDGGGDAWAFLDSFDATEPREGSPEVPQERGGRLA